ncbi:hypothetical protein ACL9RF_03145 [Sphingobacterium sp. Mn56C]|uniref:hypothetical protein n=1 Tax=Sphingobacterium sp. Mn56C TaxID=3395261 RepID=UPI003BCA8BFF
MLSWLKRNYRAQNSVPVPFPVPVELVERSASAREAELEDEAQGKAKQEQGAMQGRAAIWQKDEQAMEEEIIVVEGAKIKMGAHLGTFKVLHNGPAVQGRSIGTVEDRSTANFTFDDGFVVSEILGEWLDYGTAKTQNNAVLLTKSTLPVQGIMPQNTSPELGFIEFIESGQVHIPTHICAAELAPIPENEALDFAIKLEHLKSDFVPPGVANFKGTAEKNYIKFKLTVSGKGVEQWHFVIEQQGRVVYEIFSTTVEAESVCSSRFWHAGVYYINWDGLDTDKIYDSAVFTCDSGFKATLTGQTATKKKAASTVAFKYAYKEVRWLDVKIHTTMRQVDVTLRVNFQDGGARGLDSARKGLFRGYRSDLKDAWDNLPLQALDIGKPPIKTQIRSFKDLVNLALQGLCYHWGRNKKHAVAQDVCLAGERYEVFIQAIPTAENAMPATLLIFNTNNAWLRSTNPGSLTADPISWLGNLVARRVICYNVGYIQYGGGWGYEREAYEDIKFRETVAHEIGHEILKAYGGTIYSYGHKGTVNLITQNKNSNAPLYPTSGEIDIMPYYQNRVPIQDFSRFVAHEKDVLGLIGLSKLKSK